MPEVDLPYRFNPRSYQREVFNAREDGIRFFDLCWHRRAGKDKTSLNVLIREMGRRVGNYFYLLPTKVGARDKVWETIGSDGLKFTDHFPPAIVDTKRDQEMFIKLKNQSTFKILGTDSDPNDLRGPNPIGIVFAEWSLHSEEAWRVCQPILLENGGWAIFNYTPQGQNHAYSMHEMAQRSPEWFSTTKTIKDTLRDAPGEARVAVINEADLHRIRVEAIASGQPASEVEAFIQQEYYCSFAGFMVGSYYGHLMAQAKMEGRIGLVPHEPNLPVETAWDLGMSDTNPIWFFQRVGRQIRLIDYIEGSGEGMQGYIRLLKEKPYIYSHHWAPHDIAVRDWSAGIEAKSRQAIAASLGIRFDIVANIPVQDGINAVRSTLPRCVFDAEKCALGVKALMGYKRKYNEQRKVFENNPQHDWTSHAADAFRYLALSNDTAIVSRPIPVRAETEFSVFH